MSRYGVPYMGSKNFIAEDIVSALPCAEHFYDLFAGGCAVTHCALLKSKYKAYTINDINLAPELFFDAVMGKYKDECRWISREDFFAQKEADPYVKYCWSFGNDGQSYMYGRDIENLRKLQWEMCFAPTPYERKLKMRAVMHEIYDMGLLLCRGNASKENAVSKKMVENVARLKGTKDLQSLESLKSLESLENLQRLQRLQSLQSLQQAAGGLCLKQGDYRDVKILPDSVIYCDIPYRNTKGYTNKSGDNFDYEAFYDWAENQKELVFISEYKMPGNRFDCVLEIKKNVTMNGGGANYATERLFCPKGQKAQARQPKLELENAEIGDTINENHGVFSCNTAK